MRQRIACNRPFERLYNRTEHGTEKATYYYYFYCLWKKSADSVQESATIFNEAHVVVASMEKGTVPRWSY